MASPAWSSARSPSTPAVTEPAAAAGHASGRTSAVSTGPDAGGAQGRRDRPRAVSVQLSARDTAQMRALGARLAGLLRAGDLVLLTGALGAGKTTLVQGIGAGLGVRGAVTSPTFVIARVHRSTGGGPDLVHADAYRLGTRAEFDDLDLDADLDRSVVVVEWGEGVAEQLAQAHLLVAIERPSGAAGPAPGGEPGDEPRLVTMTGFGQRWLDSPMIRQLSRPI
jgi:tRNA threonylcarbamoyladenosine biosynthesis protein TsaE